MFYEATILNVNVNEVKEIELVGEPKVVVVEELKKKEEVVVDEVKVAMDKLKELRAQLEELKGGTGAPSPKVSNAGGGKVKKNHKESKAHAGRTYVLLTNKLETWGRVPQQQLDIAAIMAESMTVGDPWTEEELFELLKCSRNEYESLRKSDQDVTYLFRYYRGLKNDGKYAGYIGRNFVRMVG